MLNDRHEDHHRLESGLVRLAGGGVLVPYLNRGLANAITCSHSRN
jgi:hypothetical protein